MIVPWWAKLAAVLALMAASYYMGSSSASTSERLDVATRDNGAWAERAVLQAKLSTADQQLAASQALIMQGVGYRVIKKEVIYRERIKDPVVHRCVADSGLLDLYDASLGLGSTAE